MANVAGFFLKYGFYSVAIGVGAYACLLGLLTTKVFQAHAVYLHAIEMTWFKDLNVPEMFGFLRNQVTPFSIKSLDGETLFAWHVLPLELYRQHESELVLQPAGHVYDITSTLNFKLLRDDPEALLVIHMHGAGGTVASGYRCPNYRALSACDPQKVHVLTFDYRGFGRSTGSPSERGLLMDALAVVEWATKVAGIPPSRIAFFAQSMGTAVTLGVLEHFALQSPPVQFSGVVLVAPFVDVPTLVSTYRIAGTVPLLSPLARFPVLFRYLNTWIKDKWPSKDRIAAYVRNNEVNNIKYQLTVIHAEDDYDIPWEHTPKVFWHAVNATMQGGLSYDDFKEDKKKRKLDLGAAGSVVEWRTENGIIREEILKYGLHDVIMGSPTISIAMKRIIEVAKKFSRSQGIIDNPGSKQT